MMVKSDRILKNNSQIAKYLNCFQDAIEHRNCSLRWERTVCKSAIAIVLAIAHGAKPGNTIDI